MSTPITSAQGSRKYPPGWAHEYLRTQGIEVLMYVSFYLRLLLIYGMFFGVEYAIIWMETTFLASNLRRYPEVAAIADLVEIGLAAVTILAVAIHGVIGTLHLVRSEVRLMRDFESQMEGDQDNGYEPQRAASVGSPAPTEQPRATAP